MSFFLFIKKLFEPLPPLEAWALSNANRCSADQIIAAAIVQSVAKDFDSWEIRVSSGKLVDKRKIEAKWFVNKKEDAVCTIKDRKLRWEFVGDGVFLRGPKATVEIGLERAARDGDNSAPWYYCNKQNVDGIEISKDAADTIVQNVLKIYNQKEAALQVALKAKKEMERTQAAWNLAERLLGMKRNENGALVPITTVEEG